jgi:hypothetical protein
MSYTKDRSAASRGVGAVAANDLPQNQVGAVVRTGHGPVRIVASKEKRAGWRRWSPSVFDTDPLAGTGDYSSVFGMGGVEVRTYGGGFIDSPRARAKGYSRKDIENRRANKFPEQLRWDKEDALALAKQKAKQAEQTKKDAAKKKKYEKELAAARARRAKRKAQTGLSLIIPVVGTVGSKVVPTLPVVPPVSSGGASSYGGGGGGGGGGFTMPAPRGADISSGGGAPAPDDFTDIPGMGPGPEAAPTAETSAAQDAQQAAEMVKEAAVTAATTPLSGGTKLLIGLGIGYLAYTMFSGKGKKGSI